MLEQLKLQMQLREKNAQITALREKQTKWKKRQDELATALEELGDSASDEDVQAVNDSINALETEIGDTDIDKDVADLEEEIRALETKLTEINEKAETASGTKDAPAEREREAISHMNKRTIFGALAPETRSAMLARDDVKEFLQRVRDLKGQSRSVTNAELNIPDVMLGVIRENVEKYSKLIGKVTLRKVNGTARQNILGGIPEAVWTEAIANFNEASIEYNQLEVDGFKTAAFIAVPNSTLEDSDENLATVIFEMLTQGLGKSLDKAIVFGNGVKMPLGIATRLAQTAQPSDWGTKVPTWTDLHTTNIQKYDASGTTGAAFFRAIAAAFGIPNGDYSASKGMIWLMNHKTHMDIAAKVIDLNAAGAIVSGIGGTMPVIGGEIIELDFIADYDIIGGFGDIYLLAERSGASLSSSEHVRFLNDQTVFVGSARYDGKPIKGEGFVIFNYNNTNPTTTTAFAADSANTDLVSLSNLTIGTTPVALFPPFSKDVLNYKATVSAHSNKITATALKSDATVSIKNGTTAVNSGSNATFTAGDNVLSIEVTNGNATKRTYTVTVTDATA